MSGTPSGIMGGPASGPSGGTTATVPSGIMGEPAAPASGGGSGGVRPGAPVAAAPPSLGAEIDDFFAAEPAPTGPAPGGEDDVARALRLNEEKQQRESGMAQAKTAYLAAETPKIRAELGTLFGTEFTPSQLDLMAKREAANQLNNLLAAQALVQQQAPQVVGPHIQQQLQTQAADDAAYSRFSAKHSDLSDPRLRGVLDSTAKNLANTMQQMGHRVASEDAFFELVAQQVRGIIQHRVRPGGATGTGNQPVAGGGMAPHIPAQGGGRAAPRQPAGGAGQESELDKFMALQQRFNA